MKRGTEQKREIDQAHNLIFYVSDYVDVSAGHAWKMDKRWAVTEQVEKNLANCKVMKYTEYQGERLDAESVGIIFPSRMWGISLAVYAFLQNLRVSEHTYVYAVAIGEVLSAEVNGTADVRMQTLGQFQDIFEQRHLGSISDIYIRCIDYKRAFTTTEEKLLSSIQIRERIDDVLKGMLFYSMKDVREQKLQVVTDTARQNVDVDASDTSASSYRQVPKRKSVGTAADAPARPGLHTDKIVRMPNLHNVFLDDDLLSEVRICQAM